MSLRCLRKQLTELVPSVNNSLVWSFFKLFDSLVADYQKQAKLLLAEMPPPEDDSEPENPLKWSKSLIESIFIYTLLWTIGNTGDSAARQKFDTWLKGQMKTNNLTIKHSETETDLLVDFCLNPMNGGSWMPWMDTVPVYEQDPKQDFTEILVPTMDSVRAEYMLKILISARRNVLCTGNTGTGNDRQLWPI